jgi:hypothetical protein
LKRLYGEGPAPGMVAFSDVGNIGRRFDPGNAKEALSPEVVAERKTAPKLNSGKFCRR